MRRLVEQHTVLSTLPEHIKERLVVCPMGSGLQFQGIVISEEGGDEMG